MVYTVSERGDGESVMEETTTSPYRMDQRCKSAFSIHLSRGEGFETYTVFCENRSISASSIISSRVILYLGFMMHCAIDYFLKKIINFLHLFTLLHF